MKTNRWNGSAGARFLLFLTAAVLLSACEDQLLPPKAGETPAPSTLRIYYVDTIGAASDFTTVWSVGADGSDLRRVAPGLVGYYPNGGQVAYYVDSELGNPPAIYVAARDGSSPQLRMSGAPDGRQLLPDFAFSSTGTIAAVSLADGGGETETWLELDAPAGSRSVPLGMRGSSTDDNAGPRFDPSGSYVAIAATVDDFGASAVVLVDVSSGTIDTLAPVGYVPLSFDIFDWSPDGSRIVYTFGDFGDATLAVLDIATRRVDTIATIPGVSCLSPRWLPNGKEIAFIQVGNGSSDIFLADVKSRTIRRLTATPLTLEYELDVAPDGTALAYLWIDPYSPSYAANLSLMDLRSTVSTRVLARNIFQAVWER